MPLAAYRSGALGGGAQRERRLRSGAGGLFSHAKLRFLQGLSVAETAVIMGRNEGAVKALQHRAIRRLASLVPAELR